MNIAVLLTNDDPSPFAQAFADDGHKLVNLLQPLRPAWRFRVLRVVDGELPQDPHAFDGYVITGSPASVNDASLAWIEPLLRFIRSTHAARRALMGVCFGHQAIAKALGGNVMRHAGGWGLGLHATTWFDADIHGLASWMSPRQRPMSLLAAHNEQVVDLPAEARLLSGSAFCPHGSFSIGRHILTTQYHPEMTPRFMHALLGHLDDLAARGTVITPQAVEAARMSLSDIDPGQDTPLRDAVVMAQWMVQFVEQAQ